MSTIVVCVKQVGALSDEVEFVDDGTAVDPDFLETAINEWDAYALEEALRIRDEVPGSSVIAISAGPEAADAVLVRALAMGADRAVRVNVEDDAPADPIVIAGALATAVQLAQPDLVLCGAQSADAAHGATGAALSAYLDWPIIAVVSELRLDALAAVVVAHRELEGGLVEILDVDLPAVLTVQTGINEPRYVTMRSLQAAGSAPIEVLDAPDPAPGFRVVSMEVPAKSRAELDGSAAQIAERITELVKAAQA